MEPRLLEFKRITEKNIEDAEQMVIGDQTYGTEGHAIEDIFKKHTKNDDISIVMMKICLLDFTNGTNINKHRKKISLYEIAKKITDIKNIDSRIEEGDPKVVNEIAKCIGFSIQLITRCLSGLLSLMCGIAKNKTLGD